MTTSPAASWECLICCDHLSAEEAAQWLVAASANATATATGTITTGEEATTASPCLPIMSYNCQHSLCCHCVQRLLQTKEHKVNRKYIKCEWCQTDHAFRHDRMNVNLAVVQMLAQQQQVGVQLPYGDSLCHGVAQRPPSVEPCANETPPTTTPARNGTAPLDDERKPAARATSPPLGTSIRDSSSSSSSSEEPKDRRGDEATTDHRTTSGFLPLRWASRMNDLLPAWASRGNEKTDTDPPPGDELWGTSVQNAVALDDSTSTDEWNMASRAGSTTPSGTTDSNWKVWYCENCQGTCTPPQAAQFTKKVKEIIQRHGKKKQKRASIEFSHDCVPIMSMGCSHSICSSCILDLDREGKQTNSNLVNLKCPICEANEAFRLDRMNTNGAVVELLLNGYTAPATTASQHTATHSVAAEIPPLSAVVKRKKSPPSQAPKPKKKIGVGATKPATSRPLPREVACLVDSLTVILRGDRKEKLRAQTRIGKLEKAQQNDDDSEKLIASQVKCYPERARPASMMSSQPSQRYLGQRNGLTEPAMLQQQVPGRKEPAHPASANPLPVKRPRRSPAKDRDETDEVNSNRNKHTESRFGSARKSVVRTRNLAPMPNNIYSPHHSEIGATVVLPKRAAMSISSMKQPRPAFLAHDPATGHISTRRRMDVPAGDCFTGTAPVPHRPPWRSLDRGFVDAAFPTYGNAPTLSLPPPFPTICLVKAVSSSGTNDEAEVETKQNVRNSCVSRGTRPGN